MTTEGRGRALCCFLLLHLCLASVASARLIQEGGATACKSLSPDGTKRLTFRSPPITFRPGDVSNKIYVAEAPVGHIGIRDFVAELVDESGASVPLSEVYLHHWVMIEEAVPKKHYARHVNHLLKRLKGQNYHMHHMHHQATHLASFEAGGNGMVRGARPQRAHLGFGKGGETRKTFSNLPAPYAKGSGNPLDIPEGFERVWFLNVHGLDTRGAVDRMGCTECRCALFNATTNERGQPLPEGYLGGLECCTDGRRCAVKDGYNGEERTLYLQYTWEYVEWDECVIPIVREVGLDITDKDGLGRGSIEFTIEGCGDADPKSEDCVETKVATLVSPVGGDIVLVQSHLHAASINSTLWGEDGRLICTAAPIYGEGCEAGNEQGYVVGITTCHSTPGSTNALKIKQGEKLKYVVQYTKVGGPHTGLMGLVSATLAPTGAAALL